MLVAYKAASELLGKLPQKCDERVDRWGSKLASMDFSAFGASEVFRTYLAEEDSGNVAFRCGMNQGGRRRMSGFLPRHRRRRQRHEKVVVRRVSMGGLGTCVRASLRCCTLSWRAAVSRG